MSIKRFIAISIIAISVLLLVLFMKIYQSQQMQYEIIEKEETRFNSLRLAKELLQSSDDLTRMARSYAVTGNSIYKDYFYQILAIRDGHMPRPYVDSSTYWHLEGIGEATNGYTGEAISLIELMRREGLTDDEFALIEQAKLNSDRLVEIEQQAFNAIEGLTGNSGSNDYSNQSEPDLALAQALLWGEEYTREKAKIMLPIKRFIVKLDKRTQDDLDSARIELKSILLQQHIIFTFLLLNVVAIIVYTWRHITLPLQRLIKRTKAIADGDYTARCLIVGSNEIADLTTDFNKMAYSIEETIAKHEQALNLLHTSEVRLLEAQRQARIGYWDVNLDDNKSHWSNQMLDILELDSEKIDISYKDFLNTIHPDDRSKVDLFYRNSLRNHQQYEINHRLLMSDGRIKWACQRGTTVFDEKNKPVRILITLQEISKQKELELFLDYQISSMNERIKELKCLNQLSDLSRKINISLEQFLESATQMLPPAWSRPELVSARIEYDGQHYQTENFEESTHTINSSIILSGIQRGKIEIFYKAKASNTDPFLPEEYRLLETIGHQVSQTIDKKLTESQMKLYASVFEQSREAIAICNHKKEIIAVNQSFYQLTNLTPNRILGNSYHFLISEYVLPEQQKVIFQNLKKNGEWRGELKFYSTKKHIFTAWSSITEIRNHSNKINNYIITLSDITDYKNAMDHIERLARYDVLTNLPNRFTCIERLQQAINFARRNKEKVAVMFIDLDRFKLINDTLGHAIGDLLLTQVAERLKNSVRNSDIVARLGGDEFVVVLSEQETADTVFRVADKILRNLGQPYQLENHEIFSSPSIGIAFFPDDGESIEEVMKNADVAMYHAKSEGRNNYQFFTQLMNKDNLERLALEKDLRVAIEQEQFILYFQPKIDADTMWITGMEALIRWKHPTKGLISPVTLFL